MKMKIYYGSAITIDRSLLPVYRATVNALKKLGHEVLSEYVVDPKLKKGDDLSPKALFERETKTINQSDAVVADVTSPSWGTAFLVEHAIEAGKPVLLLHYKDSDKPLPIMIKGHPEVYIAHYTRGNIRTILKKNLEYFMSMKNRKGKLVVIDGADGSGKATQTEMLLKYLEKKELKNKYIDFPRYYTSFHGKMVGRYLSGEFGGMDSADPYLVSLLYALDRLTARDEMVDWLEEGNVVVANRYTTSNMAFQTARVDKKERKKFLDWLYTMEYKEHKLPKEDLVLFLHVPIEVSQKLLEKKAKSKSRRYIKGDEEKDVHESDVEYQREVLKMYLKLAKKFKHWEVVECVDSKNELLSVDEVHAKIVKVLNKHEIIERE